VGIYGIKGIADPANVPGGKWGAISWIDSSSKLWLFGGYGVYMPGNAGLINDLWNYDPTSNEWTWISGSNDAYQAGTYGTKGIAAPSNVPGARCQPLSWLDSSGNLWLFGGEGNDSASPYQGPLNDLWKYDPSVQEWTWISGSDIREQPGIYGTRGISDPSNVPGARSAALSWLDSSGNLWLFGGSGVNYSNLSDLWRYNR
jgi:N-acetylneuraminic acid mutarotase